MLAENLDDQTISIHLFINTGIIGAPGTPPNDWTNDTYWGGPWFDIPAGQTVLLTLSFGYAEAWNITDNKVPHTGGGLSWPDGNWYAINAFDQGEVTAIGFEVADFSGTNPNGTLRLTPITVPSHVYAEDDFFGSTVGSLVWFPGGIPCTFGFDGFSSIQEGIDSVAGSTVEVASGTYNEQVRINKSVTVTGSGTVLIDPNGAEFEGPKAGVDKVRAAVTFETGCTGALLENVTIQNDYASDLNGNSGIEVIDGDIDDVTVRNVVVDDVAGHGFGSYETDHTWPPPSGWVVEGCSFSTSGTSSSGMRPQNMDDLTIESCDVGPTEYGGILLININGGVVQDCQVHNTVRAGIQIDSYCTSTIDILRNEVWATNSSSSSDYGDIRFYGQYLPDPHGDPAATVTVNYNRLHDGYNGVCVKSGQDITTRTIIVEYNCISDHSNYGALNSGTGSLDAESNWWGDASGPDGSGDAVSGNVDYEPYIGGSGGENIVCDPDPLQLSNGSSSGTVDVNYLGGACGLIYGYSIQFTWDGSKVSTSPGNVTQGDLLPVGSGVSLFDARSTGTNQITVDCAVLGTHPGVSGPGTMFTVGFSAVASGTSPIDITIDRFRDCNNATIYGFDEDDGEVEVDITNPIISGVLITNTTMSLTSLIKDGDDATVMATVTDNDPGFDASNIWANLTGLGGGAAVNPGSYNSSTGEATWTLSGVSCTPSNGTVTVTVDATDDFGNQATQGSDVITSDNIAPAISDVLIANLTTSDNTYAKDGDDLELTATVTDANGLGTSNITADLSELLDGGGTSVDAQTYASDVATWTSALASVDLTSPDGAKDVTVSATDVVGNVGSPASDDIIVDNTDPTSSAGPLSPWQNGLTFNVPYTASDGSGSGIKDVELFYQLDGGGYSSYGTFTSSPISFTGTSEGEYDFYTVAEDNSGNVETAPGSADATTEVDMTAPVFTDVSITNLSLAHTDDYAKNGDDLKLTATVSDARYTLTTDDITADLSTLLSGGGDEVPAESYTGGVATWTTALAGVTLTSDGSKTVTVTATDGAGNNSDDSDDIIVDTTSPSPVSGFSALPFSSVNLAWDDASGNDTHYEGVMIRRTAWGDYPTYIGPAPDYPADPTEGTEVFSGDETSYNDPISGLQLATRDIYYYQAFAYDHARNYSDEDAGARDRSTNYFLGDFFGPGSDPFDGVIDFHDLTPFSDCYGIVSPGSDCDDCDIGPTDDYTRVGVPEPDDEIEFEDLMIFAMNYMNVPLLEPGIAIPLSTLHVWNLGMTMEMPGATGPVGDPFEVRLESWNISEIVKGIHVRLEYDPEVLEFLSGAEGEALSDMSRSSGRIPFFYAYKKGHAVDVSLAILGEGTFDVEGEVSVLTFRVLRQEPVSMHLYAEFRGEQNQILMSVEKASELTAVPSGVPSSYGIHRAYPNPFTRETEITYGLPEACRAVLEVYDATGRRVVTLHDGMREAGYHKVLWDGCDDSERTMGAGVYFCKLRVKDRVITEKLMLMR
jgi:hypothetical protein